MKKTVSFCLLTALFVILSGCSSTLEIHADAPRPLFREFHRLSDEILQSGGLAVVGMAESKSLDLALNKAKTAGRIKLADLLEARIETIRNDFIEETGLDKKDPLLEPFENLAKTITTDQIQGLVANELKYETIDDTVTAYSLMALSPEIIVDHLAKEKELYPRFRISKTCETLNREINSYNALPAE